MTRVLKISGHEIDQPAFLTAFAAAMADLREPVVIVHGGGKEITQLQEWMGITPQYVEGVRVTDAESLALVEMVLCGAVNKRLVRTLIHGGVDAVGLSGVDFAMVRAVKMARADVDMQFTGQVETVRIEPLQAFLGAGLTPVIAPICIGVDSNFNVNADHVAGAIAAALNADQLIFLSNVPGVLLNGAMIARLTDEQAEAMITDETIFGGMIPKVRTAIEAVGHGVRAAVITNLDGLRAGTGTAIVRGTNG